MIYLTENLRAFRRAAGMTQEEVAEAAGVSPQSVSKWERGETYPDVTLLPTLAILFGTSIDALVGMERINADRARGGVFTEAHRHFRAGDYEESARVLREALRIYANDAAIMCELGMTLYFTGNKEEMGQAIRLLEAVVTGHGNEKVGHTARAALCFLYRKAGEEERAVWAARQLPHVRESREEVLAALQSSRDEADMAAYMRLIVLGEKD